MTDCIESGEAREIAKKLRYTADDDLGGLSLQKNLAAITKAEDGSWRGVMRRLREGRRFRIAVSECNPFTTCAFESRWVLDFASWGEYQDWLNAEYDDGTIKWEEDAR